LDLKSKQVQEFKETKIGDVCPFVYGKGLAKKVRNTGKIPVYGSNGIVGWHNKSFLSGPCIIIGRKGSIGKIHYSQIPCWPIDTTFYIEENQNYHLKFIFYLLKFINLENMDSDTSVPGLNRNAAHEVKISIPEKIGQMRISQVLENIDIKIYNLQNQNCVLEQIAQSTFKSWFVNYDGVTEFEDSELGKIPKGWRVGNLGDICEIIMGSSPPGKSYNKVGDGIIFFQGKTDYNDFFPTPRMYCTMPKRFAEKNDVLFTVRAPIGSINIAKEKYCIGRGLASLRLKGNHGCFLYFFLKGLEGKWNEFEANGTVFGSMNKDDLNGFKLIISPIELRIKFNNIMKPIYNLIWKNNLNHQSLTQTRDALLPKLMSGEIIV
jgi:type I restriction enzyme, S subunit